MAEVFVTGATGYLGRRLIPVLLQRGHRVTALARASSQHKVPPGCALVVGDALDHTTFSDRVPPASTFVQLVGVPRPAPSKARQFREIDLVSVRESVAAAVKAGVQHFVYVSVAQPAPVMKAYVQVRAEGETIVRASGLRATLLRPWYILGPGHRWPYLLLPMYAVLERLPGTRDTAVRLGLVRLSEMIRALAHAVETPPDGIRIVTVPEIRAMS